MSEILLLLIIIFFVWPIIKVSLMVNRVKKNARQAYQTMYGNKTKERPAERKAGWSATPKAKKKKIDRSIGEYVLFEEMPCTDTGTRPSQPADFVIESQITDVEWEDIK